MTAIDRFWLRADKNGDMVEVIKTRCWHWISSSKNKRPQINVGNGKIVSTHKFIWEYVYGEVPKGKYVVRRCNNPICVNVNHLLLGTLSDVRQKVIIAWDGTRFKQCSRCKEFYPFTSEFFHCDSSHITGLHGRCKSCSSEVNKETNIRQWKRYLLTQCRESANRRKQEFNLTEKDIQRMLDDQGGRCYWFGVPLASSKEYRYPLKPSIDRLDRNKGYLKENVVLCCQVANIGRNAGKLSSFLEFLTILPNHLSDAPWKLEEKWQRR